MQLVEFDFREMVSVSGNEVVTTSLKVAEYFGKKHKNVLRAISNLKSKISEDRYRLNFEPIDFIDKNGETQIEIQMTRDGFTLLVMGFTGDKAMEFKCNYMDAFNWMANKLKELQSAPVIELMANLKALPEITKRASFYGKGLRETGMAKKKLTQRIDELTAQIQLPLLD